MKRSYFLLIVMVLAMLPGIVSACPNCKEAYSESGAPVAAGYSASILFLMITPFVVMGIVALRIMLSVRKRRRLESGAQ